MVSLKVRVTLGICLSVGVASARADQVVIGAAKDNTLYEDPGGGLSNGAGEYFFAGRIQMRNDGLIRRALVAFDVRAVVPPDATIGRAALTLNMSKTITGPATVRLHRVLQDWGEGRSDAPGEEGGGDPAQRRDATWVHTFFDTRRWDDVGGNFDPTPSASRNVSGPGKYTWVSTPMLESDVQGWVDDPATSFGWVIIGDERTLGSAKRFDTRENVIKGNRPQLLIEFTPGACSGTEKLSVKCRDKGVDRDLIIAKLKKGRDDANVTFRLDADPGTDVARSVRRGKAKAKYKKIADGDHAVEIVQCQVSKGTSCP